MSEPEGRESLLVTLKNYQKEVADRCVEISQLAIYLENNLLGSLPKPESASAKEDKEFPGEMGFLIGISRHQLAYLFDAGQSLNRLKNEFPSDDRLVGSAKETQRR